MTRCVIDGKQCQCQPDDGDYCRMACARVTELQAENARLMSEVARLREALGNAFCPRPVHGRPAFDTVKGCQQSDNCGCDLGEAFAKP